MTKIKCKMLKLPVTLPKDAEAEQVLSVLQDVTGNRFHVSVVDDAFEHPQYMGAFLANVAHIISGQFEFDVPHKDQKQEMFALMCEAFNKRASKLKREA